MEIAVKHLCKSFGGRTVLRDLTFTAGPGITAVMAPSGTGKTTLLRILLGLERPDSGTVEGLAGKRLTAVFQEDRLLEHLSADGNLRFVLGRAYDPAAARALLDRLGLPDTGPQPVREFSGGMKRRLALARALLAPFDGGSAGTAGDPRCRRRGGIAGRHAVRKNRARRRLRAAPRCAIGLAFWERLWYNGRKAAGGRLPWLGPRPASCGTAARSTRSPRGVAQQPQRQRTAPVGGRPSNNLNPGRPSGDATKRSCLYD